MSQPKRPTTQTSAGSKSPTPAAAPGREPVANQAGSPARRYDRSCSSYQDHECLDRLSAQAEELFLLGMDCARSARKSQMIGHIESFTRQATRLLRLHNETALAIDRIRRKGEQKIVVQHVSVVANGPAVVSASVSGGETFSNSFGWTS